jgi:hypothetical protein
MNENCRKMWADPRFKIYEGVDRLLNGNKIWDGSGWYYQPIHPQQYRVVAEKVRQALDDIAKEYGVE